MQSPACGAWSAAQCRQSLSIRFRGLDQALQQEKVKPLAAAGFGSLLSCSAGEGCWALETGIAPPNLRFSTAQAGYFHNCPIQVIMT